MEDLSYLKPQAVASKAVKLLLKCESIEVPWAEKQVVGRWHGESRGTPADPKKNKALLL